MKKIFVFFKNLKPKISKVYDAKISELYTVEAIGLIIISIYTPPSTSPTYIPPYQAPKGLPDKSLDILGLRLCGSVNTQQSIVHVNK